ncbi:Glutamyl-tRNA amidotransferase subunit A, mitochondrial [Phlegmacium glaucopus]|nr:Glutamyl-tRNA amidotransferase subunit A, mitochondrial [Phlegmacium glaucopus]
MRANVARKWINLRQFQCRTLQYSTLPPTCQRRQIIAEKNPSVNAFVHVSPTPTSSSKELSLSGLTVAVKDNIATNSLPTTCSSAMLRDFVSPFDATVVKLLQDSGADIIGKTNCDEFGMGSLNIHSIHGPVKNPFNLSPEKTFNQERSAGGSSGGSAAAVAGGMCDAALGTDTGGSVRLPASYCGIVGLKPSHGLVSRWGVVSYADSFDCVGILASTIHTTKRVFDAIAVHDDLDPTAAPREIRELATRITLEKAGSMLSATSILRGLRVGIPQEYFPSELSPRIIEHVRSVLTALKENGATIVPVSLPSTSYALSSYYVLASAEASSNMARYDGIQYGSYIKPAPGTNLWKTSNVYAQTRSAGFGLEVQKRILLGTYSLSADAFDNYFLQAQRVRQLIKNDFDRVFSIPNYFSDSPTLENPAGVDVLVHPSAIQTAPILALNKPEDPTLSAYVQDVLTVPASLAGLPALSVPVRRSSMINGGITDDNQWPIGISVVGQWGTDEIVLAVGGAIESLQSEL